MRSEIDDHKLTLTARPRVNAHAGRGSRPRSPRWDGRQRGGWCSRAAPSCPVTASDTSDVRSAGAEGV